LQKKTDRSGKFKNTFWELLKSHVHFEEKKTEVDRNLRKIKKKDKVIFWGGKIPTLSIILIVKPECRH